MLWATYGRFSREGIQGMIAKPQNRAESVERLLAAYGGKLVSYHMLMNADIDFFIVSDIPDEKTSELTLINAMLVRGSGAIESITTVPALSAVDAVPQMRKVQEIASATVYEAPSKP